MGTVRVVMDRDHMWWVIGPGVRQGPYGGMQSAMDVADRIESGCTWYDDLPSPPA